MEGSWFMPAQGIKQDPISKITNAKRAGVATQVVESLPRKHKGLSSNPNTDKEDRKTSLLKRGL
jgi:hypothetical protein